MAFLTARWNEDERRARLEDEFEDGHTHPVDLTNPCDPTRVLADIAAKRQILAEHAPVLRTVEWDHDQTGKGEALCCARCQNADHSDWNPPAGQAFGLPDGFVTPYVLAPCLTLYLLAAPFVGHPDFDPAWRYR